MKTQKGITLIALIITIIVMLILVGVSVSVALNTGLFKTAQGAAKNTEGARINETAISNGTINIEGVGETNINDYVQGLNDKSQGYTHKLVLPDFECKIKADTTFADLIAEHDEFTTESISQNYMNEATGEEETFNIEAVLFNGEYLSMGTLIVEYDEVSHDKYLNVQDKVSILINKKISIDNLNNII